MEINPDFRDLLQLFNEEGVEYLVVGAYAVMYYTEPRFTKDLDLGHKPSPILTSPYPGDQDNLLMIK